MARNRAKKETLLKQIQNDLDKKLAIGQSKRNDKMKYLRDESGELVRNSDGQKIIIQEDLTRGKIYSWSTYKTYLKHSNYFAQWCRDTYNCKTLSQCEKYVNEYLQKLIDENKSAYTIKTTSAALAKLYNCSTTDFIETPKRHRENIKRSRETTVRDKHFSVKNNAELINFCQCTGLRRAELKQLRGSDLIEKDGKFYVNVTRATKGGRDRLTEIFGTKEQIESVVNRMRAAGDNKVWAKVSSNADIHGYRSEYCTRVYNAYARDLKTLDRKEIYYCKSDLAGTWYDKKAMLIASQNLGHNRINVIASNYLRS